MTHGWHAPTRTASSRGTIRRIALEPRKHTLAELFEGQLVYVVPSYQRLYVWNQGEQWEPLWSDIRDLADGLVQDANARSSDAVDPNEVEPHFLGAVVLKMSGSTPDLARQLRVIDGQQRLTTLQLAVAASVRALEDADRPTHAARLRQLTSNSSGATPNTNVTYKIDHHRHHREDDYRGFKDVMRAALSDSSSEDLDGPMAACYDFFRKAVGRWLAGYDDHVDVAASALTTTLVMKLNLVGIYLDPHEKEHVIFETLNARGEPLTEWDKIKNFLLYRADETPDLDQEEFFARYLDRFDGPWWRMKVGRGTQRPRADIFADYWLESRLREPVAVRRVFREFQKHLDSLDRHLVVTIDDLIQAADYFQRFERLGGELESREAQFHRMRLTLDIGAIWPLLLKLQRISATQTERDPWFAILESYFVRRAITGYQARSYDQIALDLIEALPTDDHTGERVENILLEHLTSYSEAANVWPSDSVVRQEILNRHMPRYIRMLALSTVESQLITDRAGSNTVSSDLQVEHILPQGWQPEFWPLPDSDNQVLAAEQRNNALQTLGNLTLLNGRLNSSISNGPWSRKREEIQKSDNLFINRRLLDEAGDEWTEEDIRKRGEWMADIIIQKWPRG